MKRSGILLLLTFMVLFLFAPTSSKAATNSYPWAQDAATELNSRGILLGDGNGNYLLGEKVTRAQFAAFVGRALNLQAMAANMSFTDVDKNNVLYNEIYQAAAAGIVNGYPDGSFRPDREITREEMAVMIDRMLKYKGIVTDAKPLSFNDSKQINHDYIEAIGNCVSLGIIQGYPEDNTFRPKNDAIRADSVVVIYRALETIENSSSWYQVGTIVNGEIQPGSKYSHLSDAENSASNTNQVVMKDNKVVWMHDGIVRTNATLTTFGDTYVPANTELKYINSDGSTITVELANNKGTVNLSDVTLVPFGMTEGQSYYDISGSSLVHHIYQPLTGKYAAYVYGAAPSFMLTGVKYYSWDGHSFFTDSQMKGTSVGTAYQYFNTLPLNTKTSYTAAQLNQYVIDHIPSTYESKMGNAGPLSTLGDAFIKAQHDYGVNALYLLAHAILESAWGSSDIALNKKNLYGLNATDNNPYGNADTFYSYEDCVYYAAQYISTKYQTPGDWHYFGATLGNKNIGMNMKYASDPYWGQKIAGIMYQIDQALGSNDFGHFNLAVTTALSLNAHSDASTTSSILYQYPEDHAGAGLIVIGTPITNKEGTWFKVQSDLSKDLDNPSYVYVYHNGSYGLLSDTVPIAGKK